MNQIKEEVYWYTKITPNPQTLSQNETCDVVVIGAGFAGLSAAQKLSGAGKSVIVLDGSIAAGGASGKSSGFITPDSELELTDLLANFGDVKGKALWEFAKSGLEHIRQTITRYNLDCDYQIQDSLFIANDAKGYEKVKEESEVQTKSGYESTLYNKETITQVIGSNTYVGGIKYPGTFGINGFAYAQGLIKHLKNEGIKIFENSPVTKIESGKVHVGNLVVTAKDIVVCADRFLPDLGIARREVYHAQTFLSISKPLSDEDVKKMFPAGKLMVWDTDLIYQYFRITGDNRLLLGAADVLYTYKPSEKHHPTKVIAKMQEYLKRKFPQINFEIEYVWPGLIGVSKDFVPVAGRHAGMPNVYFAGAGAGLPWSAALGNYLADKILTERNEFDKEFSPKRKFAVSNLIQKFITKPIAFAISHGIVKYFR